MLIAAKPATIRTRPLLMYWPPDPWPLFEPRPLYEPSLYTDKYGKWTTAQSPCVSSMPGMFKLRLLFCSMGKRQKRTQCFNVGHPNPSSQFMNQKNLSCHSETGVRGRLGEVEEQVSA